MKLSVKIVFLGLVYLLVIVLGMGKESLMHQQYAFLADSLIHGKTYFLEEPVIRAGGEWVDTVYWNGHYYWPNGVLPGLLLTVPVAIFGKPGWLPYQWTEMMGLTGVVVVLGYILFRRIGYDISGVGYLLIGLCLGSAFVGVLQEPSSYFLAHVVVVAGWLVILSEVFGRRRLWIIGTGILMVGLTRTTALLPLGFVVCLPGVSKKRLLGVVALLVLFLGGYNWQRFGSVFEFGYRMQHLTNPALMAARGRGLFSITHIPANVYYAFLAGYVPVGIQSQEVTLRFPFITYSEWGLGLVFTSPYLLWMGSRLKRVLLGYWKLWIGVGMCMLVIFGYYGIGWTQFGFRYGLDYFPVLFVIFARSYWQEYKSLRWGMKVALLGSGLLNVYLIVTRALVAKGLV